VSEKDIYLMYGIIIYFIDFDVVYKKKKKKKKKKRGMSWK
jgi:hypothetical protein